jgi:hypothetical protein
MRKLTPGQKYDVADLNFCGWSDGDGTSRDGYNVSDYFIQDGFYLGPDVHGIEPLFTEVAR